MAEMNDPYFDWLCIVVGIKKGSIHENFRRLAKELHENEFHAILKMDANRGADGMQLRVEFMNEHGEWGTATNRGPCTMLEFLVALSIRMSFLTGGEGNGRQTEYYFWRMMDNLKLSRITDDKWDYMNGEFFVEDAVWRINERQYSADGSGGLFPLRSLHGDQRGVEIWYQMNAWIMENSDFGSF